MDRLQELYSNHIESVCRKFNCMEAASLLKEGFSALCEAMVPLYESTEQATPYPQKTLEMYTVLISHIKFCLNELWYKTVSEMRKYGAFRFQCILPSCTPTIYINFLSETNSFDDDPNAIEIVTKQPLLVDFYAKTMKGDNTDDMRDSVIKAILTVLETHKNDILVRLNEGVTKYDLSSGSDMSKTELLWKLDDILNYYSPDYKTIPFNKFAYKYMDMSPTDAMEELASIIDAYGGSVVHNDYERIADYATQNNLTAAQVVNYLTGLYNIGKYKGCDRVIQLSNGLLYRDGYVYERANVIDALKSLYNSTCYEDVWETWNDNDYKRESLMHELRGNHEPLPREHLVHRPINGEAPDFKQWMNTVDESTGKRPIDTVLDNLKANGYAKNTKSGHGRDWIDYHTNEFPAVDESVEANSCHTFIESVCAELGCNELARPLQEGFSALCEASGMVMPDESA